MTEEAKPRATARDVLKAIFVLTFVLVIGPGVGVALVYAMGAFIAWDWAWVTSAWGIMRAMFLVPAFFAGLLGLLLAAKIVDELDLA